PLAERRETEDAADHGDVNCPVPLKGDGPLEEGLDQLAVAHGTSGVENGRLQTARRVTPPAFPAPAGSPPRAARGKSAAPTAGWPAGARRSAARRWRGAPPSAGGTTPPWAARRACRRGGTAPRGRRGQPPGARRPA